MADPITLEVFSDYVCPWCYLGDNRVKQLKENYDVTIKRVHFPLHPETPAEGRTLADMFGTGPEEIAQKNARMQGLMQAEGLPFKDRSHTYNSRLAQEVGKWADSLGAETQPGGEAIHDKFFEAYFVDRRNIGDVEVILDVVKAAGLDVDEARKVIEERTFKDAVDADWAKSHQYGVTGVPTFVAAGPDGQLHGLVGAQPYEGLAQLAQAVGAKKRG
ncbi:DsbA family oxidoreductase [Thalassospiraceae bacterium LMO-SO8]|nr:DsbA family oxidoreductase [Alphaproteobacteria bacterium LMO-S08]WND77286.1 DsbA family oxidoreductase [Thalassospiraceae bacterium LMO-SO8]